MELLFDRNVNQRDLAHNLADIGRICRLENIFTPNQFLNSQVHDYHGDQAYLLFVFDKEGDRIREIWKNANKNEDAACYQLNCVKPNEDPSLRGIKMVGSHKANNKYCFTDLDKSQYETREQQSKNLCNPFSKAKRDQKGDCICPYPYTGPTCFECESGFDAKPKTTKFLGKRL